MELDFFQCLFSQNLLSSRMRLRIIVKVQWQRQLDCRWWILLVIFCIRLVELFISVLLIIVVLLVFQNRWLSFMLLWVKIVKYMLFIQYLWFSMVYSGLSVFLIWLVSVGLNRQMQVWMVNVVSIRKNGYWVNLCSVIVVVLWNFLVSLFSMLLVFFIWIVWLNQLLNSIGFIVKKFISSDGIVSNISGRVIIQGDLCGVCFSLFGLCLWCGLFECMWCGLVLWCVV